MNGASEHRFRNRRGKHLGGTFASVLIILLGVAMLSDNLGLVHARDLWDFAPLLLTAIGLMKMYESQGRPAPLILGGITAAGGTVWVLGNLGIINFNPSLMFPLVIIGIGVATLLRTMERQRTLDGVSPIHEEDAMPKPMAIFAGVSRTITSQEFRGGDALAIFGGVELDARPAKMAGREAIFEANAIFGGVEMKVPAEWAVSVRGMGIFGGYEDKTKMPVSPDAPLLVVSGYAIFGGVSVSN